MDVLDVLTVLVLVTIGVRISTGTRVAFSSAGRDRIRLIVSGLRPRHLLLAVPALTAVATAIVGLMSLPLLDWGWWTAIGGVGNPVTGGTERTSGSAFQWLVPALFLALLVPALPLFAEAEERVFRLGSERRSTWGRVGKGIQFGLVHAIVGIPIGAALGLSIGGWYFTWAYLRRWRATHDTRAAMLESTRAHLGYNLVVIALVAIVVAAGGA